MKHCQIRSQLNLQGIRTHHVRANFGPSKSDHVFEWYDWWEFTVNSNYFSSEQSQQWKPIFHDKYNNGGNSICVHDTHVLWTMVEVYCISTTYFTWHLQAGNRAIAVISFSKSIHTILLFKESMPWQNDRNIKIKFIDSGQIIIFCQPRFCRKKRMPLPQLRFGVRSCDVIIWPNLMVQVQPHHTCMNESFSGTPWSDFIADFDSVTPFSYSRMKWETNKTLIKIYLYIH